MPIDDLQCHLLTLPDEIIIEILSYIPIISILKLESTCKRLYNLCRSRPVWKSVVEGLDIDQAPNLLPYQRLEALTDCDLRGKVRNAIHRHQIWNNTREMLPMRVAELPLPHIEENRLIKARLLPGGKEILLANSGNIELWSIESGHCIWTIPAPEDYIDYVGFDFDLVEGGRILIIAIVCEDNVFSSTSLLRVYAYDFQHHAGELVFERRLPHVSPSRIMLNGDFFISCIARNFQTVVINWKTSDALILDFIDPTGVRVDARAKLLADNNLIAFVHQAESGFCAVKLPLSLLKEFFSNEPDCNVWRHVPFRPSEEGYSILPLPYPRINPSGQNGSNGFGPWILAQHVFRPPWKPNAPTEIFVVAYTVSDGDETFMRLVSFRLQLSHSENSESGEGILTLVKSSSAPIGRLPRNPRNISNAGLMFSLRQQLQCFSLFSDNEQPVRGVEISSDIIPQFEDMEPNVCSVDPWSGAIAVRMPGSMKILYFD